MKVIIDTNVYISAFVYESEYLRQLVSRAPRLFDVVLTEYIASETLRVTGERSRSAVPELTAFFLNTPFSWFKIPQSFIRTVFISDTKDQPILDAAIACNADVIISGDKHFLRLGIDHPRIMRPADFIAEFIGNER